MHSFSRPYLRCLSRGGAEKVIEQVHQGIYGTYIGGRTLCHRIITQGYYWPTMRQDSQDFVRKCDVCQLFGNVIHVLAKALNSVISLWPFYRWGIDIVGPLPLATSQQKFMLVATDYFTKWAEVEAYAQVSATQLIQFLQKNIVCRFGVSHSLVWDNGP